MTIAVGAKTVASWERDWLWLQVEEGQERIYVQEPSWESLDGKLEFLLNGPNKILAKGG